MKQPVAVRGENQTRGSLEYYFELGMICGGTRQNKYS